MEAKFEELTEDMHKVYKAVAPHVEMINDPELTLFCQMYKNSKGAKNIEEPKADEGGVE